MKKLIMYQEKDPINITVEEPLGLFPNYVGIKPFLKWAGGKTQLLTELNKCTPLYYNKYIEPFIGGGAMFFNLNPSISLISDANEELIITYNEIKNNVEEVISLLKTFEHTEDFFYRIRALNPIELENVYRAARLIYLNKTCFNGLYRVNKKGLFNVPYGKGSGNFLQESLLRDANEFLQNTTILHSDYLKVLQNYSEPNDFIFLDPPYHPISPNSDFKRYTKEFFYDEDQKKLNDEFKRLVNLGCNVLLTNSYHPFILDLYKDFEIRIIETKRMISSNSNTRNGKDIIVIGKNE
ncbi:MAG: Dam family site-specific DNA-(adenine-N6)-methyltransferase [Paludibacteraceae bacterium]|nr:Dam family site-specific DNA-(adenine-N6)-methyltransferase [Paludibacteraceae bacterium]